MAAELCHISGWHDNHSRRLVPAGAKGTWQRSGACVDYQVFTCELPEFDRSGWESAVAGMRTLGQCESNACGVTTVRGDWGFFQIPVPGFPELKVTFFQTARRRRQRRLLDTLADILRRNIGRT